MLKDSLIGIEKEGLRVSDSGSIANTKHPYALGSALTNPYITTDFSESLVELVTPPLRSSQALAFLAKTQQYLYHNLANNESFWTASMPCIINGKTNIPIAKYGTSNHGKMKYVYRLGLANRYGYTMQSIAGIHFNYSYSKDFFSKYKSIIQPKADIRDFIDNNYMALSRNIIRYGWIIFYLFGASSAICKSFVKGSKHDSLVEFDDNSLYGVYATSLRMGDIGYQDIKNKTTANYDNLNSYIQSLKYSMETSCYDYELIGLKKSGEYQQLNTNILQIENEYYSAVRPKPTYVFNQKPLDTLKENGISYIELRSLDINSLNPIGIDQAQINFLEIFILFCLLTESPPITKTEQEEINNINRLVAHKGRLKSLMVKYQNQEVLLKKLGLTIIDKVKLCAELFSLETQHSIKDIIKRMDNPDLTPSAIILRQMRENNQGFFDYINSLSKKYKADFLKQKIDKKHFKYMDENAITSHLKQAKMEQENNLSFDNFLANYFNK